MNQVIKFPDLRAPKSREPIPELPPPSQYRLTSPGIIASDTFSRSAPPSRRRLFMWFGVAVALHASLFLAIWLTPPLRLKWTPSPSDWVPVVSLPPPAATPSPPGATAPVRPGGELPDLAKATAPKAKARSTNRTAPTSAVPSSGAAASGSPPFPPPPPPSPSAGQPR